MSIYQAVERDAVRKATPCLASLPAWRHDGAGLEAGWPSLLHICLPVNGVVSAVVVRLPSSSVHLHKKPFRNSGRSIVSVRRGRRPKWSCMSEASDVDGRTGRRSIGKDAAAVAAPMNARRSFANE